MAKNGVQHSIALAVMMSNTIMCSKLESQLDIQSYLSYLFIQSIFPISIHAKTKHTPNIKQDKYTARQPRLKQS